MLYDQYFIDDLKDRADLVRRAIFALVFIFASTVGAIAQEPSKTPPKEDNSWMLWRTDGRLRWLMYHLEKSDVELLKAKWERIENSLREDSDDHAGSYIVPAHMTGYFLNWSKEAGYVFVRFFDVEHPCYFSYGDVETQGDIIKFIQKGESASSNCPPSSGRPADLWVPALGGEYFVPVPELAEFVDYYAGFGKYNGYFRQFENHPAFAIKTTFASKTNREAQRTENPLLPKEFSRFVKTPLSGEIIKVGKPRQRRAKLFGFRGTDFESVTPVTINIGRQNGLKVNQELALLTNDTANNETLIVTRVGKVSSNGIVIRMLDKNGKETYDKWIQSSGEFESISFTAIRPKIKVTTSPISKL